MAVDAAILRRLREQAQAQGYDPEFDRGIRDIQFELENVENNNRYADQQDEQEFTRDKYALDRSRDQSLEDLTTTMADRGILRSGINVAQQGKIGEQYVQNTDALSRRLAGNKEGRARNKLETQSRAQRQIEDLEVNRTRAQAERERIRAQEEAERVAQQKMLQDQQAALMPRWTPTGQFLPPGGNVTYNGESFDSNDQGSFEEAIERRRSRGY